MALTESSTERSRKEKLKHAWEGLPEALELLRPRRGLLLLGILFMAVNRLAGFVLPASTTYLVGNVIGNRQIHLLSVLVLVVVAATLVQGLTSYGLTQFLSKASQRLIMELRL